MTAQEAPETGLPDPLARFRNWRAFLYVAVLLNGLFIWGMWGSVADPKVAIWTKAISWLPFNVIATVLYLVFMAKTGGPDRSGRRSPGGVFHALLCLAMIAANWLAMVVA
ncbi:hypothetical protein EZJ19_05695 [Parasulfuritortus cantonensis]|uniref:Uncharacterized protein n=1 Tax=Parasulfuritortus cantonensis TaxID=2528202 RepID=A0A4R1BFW2_9PROT|nr:hypothetical protein [Parasulfuritortus cantonensis]TCJ16086.1 hypothetical protein EZJ19_05695 [Parasulfuritortus cantonensis]